MDPGLKNQPCTPLGARGKRRGCSPGATTRHSQSARVLAVFFIFLEFSNSMSNNVFLSESTVFVLTHPAHYHRGYLLMPSPLIIKYSDDILILFYPQHLLFLPPAPFPDNPIIIVAVVCGWVVLFM